MKTKPEYWYKQSAVIPFRINDKQIEILIIKSRSNKRWIVPKGIIEENLTARTSAEKEAFEEAGVRGKIIGNKIGSYIYQKWGGSCSVKVYLLLVDEILDDWEENFRERKWILLGEIKNYIEDKNLLSLIKSVEHKIIEQAG